MPYGIGQSKPPWGDDDVARLTELVGRGLSAGEIGVVMRRTRNAIIGKVGRMGLRLHGAARPAPQTTEERRRRDRERHRRYRGDMERQGLKKPRIFVRVWNKGDHEGMAPASIGHALTDLPAQEAANPVPFHDLEPSHCRWPVSGHGLAIMFCGAPHCDNLSYCPEHYRKAYIKPTRSRTVIHWNFR